MKTFRTDQKLTCHVVGERPTHVFGLFTHNVLLSRRLAHPNFREDSSGLPKTSQRVADWGRIVQCKQGLRQGVTARNTAAHIWSFFGLNNKNESMLIS